MPIYKYKCLSGHEIEETRGIKDPQKNICCPICGDALKQTYSPPLIQLKGTGFYKNSK